MMIKAQDIMTEDVITVFPETEITQAAKIMLERHLNGLPVIDQDGHLMGIICQEDLVVQQMKIPLPSVFTFFDSLITFSSYKKLDKEVEKMTAMTVAQAMTPDPMTVEIGTGLEEIATIMVNNNVHTLPVLNKGKIVGIIGKEDVLRTLMPPNQR
jgi:CBS-domain-containing membrane protein